MPVSANTLFHFTEKSKLHGILNNFFYPQYSLEDLSNVTPKKSIYDSTYIPMVCFCDLLLSQIKDHINFYGDYGLGLRKNWGLNNGICPIYYVPQETTSALFIQQMAKEISLKIKAKDERDAIRKQLHNLYKYLKPYDGLAFNRKEKKMEDHIFYDEREWRFVPSNLYVISETATSKSDIKKTNKKLELDKKLSFKAEDIKYIIVKEEKEIPDFVEFIEDELENSFIPSEKKLLVSKLISVEQIKDDM
jgi:hypothetical protein